MVDKRHRHRTAVTRAAVNGAPHRAASSNPNAFQGDPFMQKKSTRRFVRTASALALVIGLGTGIAAAQDRFVMPAPRVEVIPVAPGADYHWVPGHWAWRGGAWDWIPGHHIRGAVAAMPAEIVEVVPARPSPGHVWIKGHHVFENGRWVWHPGVWIRS
jgi:hypothetical protein